MAQAQGQLAYTAKMVNVRAGPARDYPIVAVLPPGFPVGVQGCLPDYSWCDVIAEASRGWVYGGNINYAYQNSYVPVLNYGAIIGIGVLAFVLDDYWGRHYRNRPFYGERHRWISRPAPGPRFNGPAPRPRLGPPRTRDSNPSGAVLPGAPAPRPPRSGPNPSGAVIPGVQPPAQQPGAGRTPRIRPQQREPAPQAGGSGARNPRGEHKPDQERR
jgi:uncharacterized protein YraI